jgi:hypothetical protein
MSDYYGSVATVKQETGIKYTDLKLDSEAALTALMERWMTGITDAIDRFINQVYNRETAPAGLIRIAEMAAADLCGIAIQRRDTPIVRVDDFNIKMVESQLLTTARKADLQLYAEKRRPTINIFRINTGDDE